MELEWFSLSAPVNWNTVGKDEFPTPKVWSVALAIASDSEKEGYINNLMVLEIEKTLGESSKWLMQSTRVWLKASLKKFSVIEEKDITFTDGDDSTILTYKGQYSNGTPELTYLQTARNCWEKSYFLTLSLAEETNSLEKYEYLMSTFECAS